MDESIGNYGVGESSKQRSVREQRNIIKNKMNKVWKNPYYDQENLIREVRILCLKRKQKLVAPTIHDYREPRREKFQTIIGYSKR